MAHILVVEDNEDLAFGLSRSLEGEGHTVEVAADGETGVRLAPSGARRSCCSTSCSPGWTASARSRRCGAPG
jgi:CheY-like chemotaxis protein